MPKRAIWVMANVSKHEAKLMNGEEALTSVVATRKIIIFDSFSKIYLSASMGWATVLFLPNGVATEKGTRIFESFWIILYALTIMLALYRFPKITRRVVIVSILGFYIDLSVFWSYQPLKTSLYGGAISANILFCILLADRWDLDKFQKSITDIIVASCFLGIMLWIIGWNGVLYVDVHDRSTLIGTEPLRFFFSHKIMAGVYCVVALVFNETANKGAYRKFVRVFLLFCVLLSGSSSAISLAGMVVIYFYMTKWSLEAGVSGGIFLLTLALAAQAGLLLTPYFLGDILNILGRDPTLTGRTLLWSWGVGVGWERPVFGWGYAGYMESDLAQSQARSIAQFQAYEVPHFHNSYVQMFVDLGAVGLALVVLLPALIFTKVHKEYQVLGVKRSALLCALVLALLTGAFFIHLFYKHNDFSAMTIFILFLLSPVPLARKKLREGEKDSQ